MDAYTQLLVKLHTIGIQVGVSYTDVMIKKSEMYQYSGQELGNTCIEERFSINVLVLSP